MYFCICHLDVFGLIISEASVAGIITVDLKLAVLNRQWEF